MLTCCPECGEVVGISSEHCEIMLHSCLANGVGRRECFTFKKARFVVMAWSFVVGESEVSVA